MFGSKDKEVENLKRQLEGVSRQLEDVQKRSEFAIRVLRQQLAALLVGIPPSPGTVLAGLPYSEVSKEQVPDFIRSVPNLLILDVRSDEGWNHGYIPGAKHIPVNQLFTRINELSDKNRPILTVCANGNTGVTAAQLLAKEGYNLIFNALGGMAGYQGELVRPELRPLDIREIQGVDRDLIARVLEVLDRDVRPGLKRDGGDLEILAVEGGIVKLKMLGACSGCGALKKTVNDGIKNHLIKTVPGITGVEDYT